MWDAGKACFYIKLHKMYYVRSFSIFYVYRIALEHTFIPRINEKKINKTHKSKN